jgi:hypothetical protein
MRKKARKPPGKTGFCPGAIAVFLIFLMITLEDAPGLKGTPAFPSGYPRQKRVWGFYVPY